MKVSRLVIVVYFVIIGLLMVAAVMSSHQSGGEGTLDIITAVH